MKKISKICLSLLFVLGVNSTFACKIEDGYKLSQGLEFDMFCEFKSGLSLVYQDHEDVEKVRYGFVNSKGKLVIPTVYELAGEFYDDLALVKKNDKMFFIKPDGKLAFDVSDFDNVYGFSESLVLVEKDGNYGFIDKTGKIAIELQYNDAYAFDYGLATVSKGEKWGMIDKNNKVVIPFVYDEAPTFDDESVEKPMLIHAIKDKKQGMIDKNHKTIIPFNYDYLQFFKEGFAVVGKIVGKDEFEHNILKYGMIDKNNKLVVPFVYDEISNFSEGLALVGKIVGKDEFGDDILKFGYINKQGKVVIPIQFDFAESFEDGTAWVQLKDKDFYIDKKGKRVND